MAGLNQTINGAESQDTNVSNIVLQNLAIDTTQATAQLKALGYSETDTIYLRKFPPKGIKKNGNNIKMTAVKAGNLPKVQKSDSGVYFVVNGGGQHDKDVTAPRAVFFEFDSIPIEQQIMLWSEYHLPEPTLQVKTRKSVHTYYALSDSPSLDEWSQLQRDIAAHIGSDRTLINPSRVMRLAGAWHIKPGEEPVMCEIIHQSTNKYSFAELRSMVPTAPTVEESAKDLPKVDLSDRLKVEILPRLSPQQAYNWSGHNWEGEERRGKLRGCCPWHESQSGTAFYTDNVDGVWVWRCPSCEIGGTAVEYRHRMQGGNGKPRGKEFVDIVKALASEAGVTIDDAEYTPTGDRPDTLKEIQTKATPEDKYRKFREQLALALQCEDPIKREFLIEEIGINFRKSRTFIGKAVDELEQRRKPEKAKTEFDVLELLSMPSEATRYLIEDWVPVGEAILLTARPKVGKSLFAYDLAYAVATGSRFMAGPKFDGFRSKKGKVLIIQTEEGDNEIRKRLYTRGFDQVDPGQVTVWTSWKAHRHSDRARLDAALAEHRYSLVIVDSLRKVQSGSGIDENKAEFANAVYDLTDQCRSYGASLIVIHHDSKDKEAQGVDAAAGTGALPGAVWGTWRLTRVSTDEDNTKRHLSAIIRGGKSSRHEIDLTEGEGCSWMWQWRNEMGVDPGLHDKERRIIETLFRHQRAMTMGEICEVMGVGKGDRQLYRPMNRLIERGRVVISKDEKNKKLWWYSLPSTLPPETDRDLCNPDQTDVSIGTGGRSDSGDPIYSTLPFETNPSDQTYRTTAGESSPGGIGSASSARIGVPIETQHSSGLHTPGLTHGGECEQQDSGAAQWRDYNGQAVLVKDAKPYFPPRAKSIAAKPAIHELTELKGFRIGDRVQITISSFSAREQREIIARNETPELGQFGHVASFVESDLTGLPMTVVCLDSGSLHEFGFPYLTKIED